MEVINMQFDSFEKLDINVSETDTAKRLSSLHKGFQRLTLIMYPSVRRRRKELLYGSGRMRR